MNFIPKKSECSVSYWCSWHTQNIVAKIDCMKNHSLVDASVMMQGMSGAKRARAMLNEEMIFSENGFAHQFPEVRGEMYFMMDDGWDVDYGIHPDTQGWKFGSLIMSEERFPSVKGLSPAMRLKYINQRIKALGWKGIGIWIAAQRSAMDYKDPFGEKDLEYWKERILWSREAGVEYWKVDWGSQHNNVEFRKALTDMGKQLYPELIIEHAACMSAVNSYEHPDPELNGRFVGMDQTVRLTNAIAPFSDVFRSYDVLNAMCIPTTLDRLAYMLKVAGGYVNGEDECFINAALGCPCGVMRSHYCTQAAADVGDDRGWRLDEVTASLRWQRIAPAFVGTNVDCSDEILYDNRFYQKGDSWWGRADGREVTQGAPAIVARNLLASTIKVLGDTKPFIAASLNPNGAYSIAILPRVIDGVWHYPKATVTCEIPSGVDTVGVFGVKCDVVLNFNGTPDKIYVQSLIGDEAFELTDKVVVTENGKCSVNISKEFAQEAFGSSDKTPPALLIKAIY